MEAFSILRVSLFKHSEEPFMALLDEASIPHGRVQIFSSDTQNSNIIEVISTFSETMPWNAIAKTIEVWVESKSSRDVVITSEDGSVFQAKSYSPDDVKKVLPNSVEIAVIDNQPWGNG